MLIKSFKPKNRYQLIRLGSDNDGGYLAEKNSILHSTYLISLGLGHNWSFEEDFYKLTKKPIICYDGTIGYSALAKHSIKSFGRYFFRIFKSKYFRKKNFVDEMLSNIFLFLKYIKFFRNDKKHIKKNIGKKSHLLSLSEIFENFRSLNNLYLKIDIEGYEYQILDEIIYYQKKLNGLIIEFHHLDVNLNKVKNFIENLSLELVHIHPQNPAPVINDIPTQIELTFAKNPVPLTGDVQLPHELDQPANPNIKDINLIFEN
tara:strand:+ start:430 stop:1209 length:780 start_codon:yes stop_codon:yes gene_type:complete